MPFIDGGLLVAQASIDELTGASQLSLATSLDGASWTLSAPDPIVFGDEFFLHDTIEHDDRLIAVGTAGLEPGVPGIPGIWLYDPPD